MYYVIQRYVVRSKGTDYVVERKYCIDFQWRSDAQREHIKLMTKPEASNMIARLTRRNDGTVYLLRKMAPQGKTR